jgi:hypothetical protein
MTFHWSVFSIAMKLALTLKGNIRIVSDLSRKLRVTASRLSKQACNNRHEDLA